ncbi:MAG: hypothetical protein ABF969_04040 [Sporolactobacillus sp.]
MTEKQMVSALIERMRKRLSPERFAHFLATYESLKKRNEVKTNE